MGAHLASQNPGLVDDKLLTPEVGEWSLKKYRLLAYYAGMFASSMKNKWDCRVYLDLFAGAGRARIKDSKRIIYTSSFLALRVSSPFDKYIFCDTDESKLDALKQRANRDFPTRNVAYQKGDCNILAKQIRDSIPQASAQYKVLTFCFVDPYSMESLCFSTIEEIAIKYVDFFVLIPAYMDARRNLKEYLKPRNEIVEGFLGMPEWREVWNEVKGPSINFGSFIANQFGIKMQSLDYIYNGLQDTELVQLPEKNVSLYRLAFFSRDSLGYNFWQQARRNTEPQLPLF